MALKLNERYPGRFNNPSADYPQGSFKNRTTPTAKDGSYLEKDWANDKEGFFQSLIASAGIAPSGLVDKVGASQLFDALKSVIGTTAVGRLIGVQVFTSSGTYTPTAGTKSVIVEGVGGGGAGGGTQATSATQYALGQSASAGSYGKARFTSGFSGVTVTIGNGGVATTGAAGGNGGTSSFGALLSVTGGTGGSSGAPFTNTNPAASAALPGSSAPSGANIVSQTGGASAMGIAISGITITGAGGNSQLGNGATGIGLNNSGVTATEPGGGGSGACASISSSTRSGGNGAAGKMIVWEYA